VAFYLQLLITPLVSSNFSDEQWILSVGKFALLNLSRGRRGRDRMVVGFVTIYAIIAYHH
jgi:hypothetical protein